jgi:5,10-methylenetetrahydromethanopterin reductase
LAVDRGAKVSSSRIQFGHVSFCPPLRGAALAAEDEAAGFDIRYFGDNSCLGSDPFGELRDAARATSTIRLGVGATNAVTRHPSVIANAIAGVHAASGGRAICGMARGDSALKVLGQPPQAFTPWVGATALLREYLHGGGLPVEDWVSGIRWLPDQPYGVVPIEVMCSGPRAIRAAAALADRVTITVGANPARVRWAMDILDEALAVAGRTRADVEVGTYMPVCIADDRKAAAETLRIRVKGPMHMAAVPGADLAGQPEAVRRATLRLGERYDVRHHDVTPTNPLGALVEPEVAQWFGIGGSAEYVAERLLELVELGFDYFFFADLPEAEREALTGEVFDAVRRETPA